MRILLTFCYRIITSAEHPDVHDKAQNSVLIELSLKVFPNERTPWARG